MRKRKKTLWFKARGASRNGTRHWFIVYRNRSIITIEAISAKKKHAGPPALPQLHTFRCHPRVKTANDVIQAIMSKFKADCIEKMND